MLEITAIDEITVLHLRGDLSNSEMSDLERTLHRLIKSQKCQVVLDFADVEHIHYKMCDRLLRRAGQLRRRRGDLKFAGLNDHNQDVIRFSGLTAHLEAYDSVPEAVLSFEDRYNTSRTWH